MIGKTEADELAEETSVPFGDKASFFLTELGEKGEKCRMGRVNQWSVSPLGALQPSSRNSSEGA